MSNIHLYWTPGEDFSTYTARTAWYMGYMMEKGGAAALGSKFSFGGEEMPVTARDWMDAIDAKGHALSMSVPVVLEAYMLRTTVSGPATVLYGDNYAVYAIDRGETEDVGGTTYALVWLETATDLAAISDDLRGEYIQFANGIRTQIGDVAITLEPGTSMYVVHMENTADPSGVVGREQWWQNYITQITDTSDGPVGVLVTKKGDRDQNSGVVSNVTALHVYHGRLNSAASKCTSADIVEPFPYQIEFTGRKVIS